MRGCTQHMVDERQIAPRGRGRYFRCEKLYRDRRCKNYEVMGEVIMEECGSIRRNKEYISSLLDNGPPGLMEYKLGCSPSSRRCPVYLRCSGPDRCI